MRDSRLLQLQTALSSHRGRSMPQRRHVPECCSLLCTNTDALCYVACSSLSLSLSRCNRNLCESLFFFGVLCFLFCVCERPRVRACVHIWVMPLPGDADTSGLAPETPGQRKRPRPSLKPPNSAGQAQKKKRMSVKFADTADIRLIYQRAMNHSPTNRNGATSSPNKFATHFFLFFFFFCLTTRTSFLHTFPLCFCLGQTTSC